MGAECHGEEVPPLGTYASSKMRGGNDLDEKKASGRHRVASVVERILEQGGGGIGSSTQRQGIHTPQLAFVDKIQ